ncbi:MAG: hypothetical protein ACLR3C_11080 [Eggerthella lenta]
MEAVRRHVALAARAQRGLAVPGVRVLGGAELPATSLVSFTVEGCTPTRARSSMRRACSCARAITAPSRSRGLGARSAACASFAGYSSDEDVNALLRAAALLVEQGNDSRAHR